ncbi:MAG: protein-S-isoprenylcysteine methyltransferase, partial [Pseudomonadota bacterium]
LLLVGLISDPFSAATAVWATLYFVVGAKLEERRLHARYGQAYADYAAATPFLFPLNLTKR